jgi:hypothetical protein
VRRARREHARERRRLVGRVCEVERGQRAAGEAAEQLRSRWVLCSC